MDAMRRARILAILLWLGGAAAADAAMPSAESLTAGPTVAVTAISRAGTLVTGTGGEVVLLGLRLPAGLPARWRDWQARVLDYLRENVRGRDVELVYDGPRYDRWGRHLAHVAAGDLWIQAGLLRNGLAVVDGRRGHAGVIRPMIEIEAAARRADHGLWGDGWRVLTAGPGLSEAAFAIVEGRVSEVATVRGRTYVNFGADWRDDFTVLFERGAARRARDAGIELPALAARRIRVRGRLEEWNGPLIRLTHAAALEILDAPAETARSLPP